MVFRKELFGLPLIFVLTTGAARPQEPPSQAIDWLRTRSTPLETFDPNANDRDLRPLKTILQDVQVVGIGEATHGTHEFRQLEHRVVKFLVSEMGFTGVAMESSASDIEPLDDYLVRGTGDLATALSSQGYVAWDSEEVTALFTWLRAYNVRVADERKVHVYGLDNLFNSRGRQRVRMYLEAYAPDRVAATEALFKILAEEQAAFPFKNQSARVTGALPQLESLYDFVKSEKARVGSGRPELGAVVRDVERMVQRSSAPLPESDPRRLMRSPAMGRNLVSLVNEAPQRKLVVLAANSHVSVPAPAGGPNLGSEIEAVLGKRYYVFGTSFATGPVLFRRADATGTVGPFETVVVEPPPPDSLPGVLTKVNSGPYFVNLRGPRPANIETWLQQPLVSYAVSWAAQPGPVSTTGKCPMGRFDGMLFVPNVTVTKPTKNALARGARHEGF